MGHVHSRWVGAGLPEEISFVRQQRYVSTRQAMYYNVILRRVRVTIVNVEKQ